MHDIAYYLARGFDKEVAEYYVSGRKRIVSVVPNHDFTLTLHFDNGEERIYDMKPFISDDTVFKPLKDYEVFSRVYLDDSACVSWDINPEIDSNIVWSNKLDLCPDSCYIYSIPA
ncbi:MAG: DUF2442 domain-containing protein [Clostridia bacterium]|nr:DUF2442 domain-containing protein [Clostridia bacterium]MBQ6932128.1 DUF2442 domain-containing protein [Clostridia bacterium]MBQ7101625.1 DUF2442 domain-containing protein [Clostridia bacterium]MBR3754612.1 DUF2442 domain-containing protein [Clostridia bacterium]